MKIITKAGLIRISLFLLLCAFLLVFLSLPDYRSVLIISSPDNNFKAYHLRSRSEGAIAPYGTHIFISSKWLPFPQFYLKPVFVCYCKPAIKWESFRELVIEIETIDIKKIVVKKANYNDIKIRYSDLPSKN